jgi:hypothetical protein
MIKSRRSREAETPTLAGQGLSGGAFLEYQSWHGPPWLFKWIYEHGFNDEATSDKD